MKHTTLLTVLLVLVICSADFDPKSMWPAFAAAKTAGATTRAQAIAVVRSLLTRNSSSCRIDKVQSITATRSGANWRVAAHVIMSASGRPVNEKLVWAVRSDGEAVPASQLAAEVGAGCR